MCVTYVTQCSYGTLINSAKSSQGDCKACWPANCGRRRSVRYDDVVECEDNSQQLIRSYVGWSTMMRLALDGGT
jgi:hypothetical protein